MSPLATAISLARPTTAHFRKEAVMRDMAAPYPLAILRGLQPMNVYQGTVPDETVARRRAANRRARKSRRINRMTR